MEIQEYRRPPRSRAPLQQLSQRQPLGKTVENKQNIKELVKDDSLKKATKKRVKKNKERAKQVISVRPPVPLSDTSFTEILRDNDRELRLRLEWRRRSLSKIGQLYIDFVHELAYERQILHVLHMLFSHLRPKELAIICCVSPEWNEAVHTDRRINDRRIKYLRSMRRLKNNVGTENWPIKPKQQVLASQNRLFRTIQNFIF